MKHTFRLKYSNSLLSNSIFTFRSYTSQHREIQLKLWHLYVDFCIQVFWECVLNSCAFSSWSHNFFFPRKTKSHASTYILHTYTTCFLNYCYSIQTKYCVIGQIFFECVRNFYCKFAPGIRFGDEFRRYITKYSIFGVNRSFKLSLEIDWRPSRADSQPAICLLRFNHPDYHYIFERYFSSYAILHLIQNLIALSW